MDISKYGIHILPGDCAAGTWNMVSSAEGRLWFNDSGALRKAANT